PPPPTAAPTLSLHDALPICRQKPPPRSQGKKIVCSLGLLRAIRPHPAKLDIWMSGMRMDIAMNPTAPPMNTIISGSSRLVRTWRSEEHTSELQSRSDLVCRL